jgi:serine/threonine protein kinase
MNRCDPDSGERFVAGLLSEAEESTFVEHLDTCAACRSVLEAVAGDDEAWQAARELLVYSCAGEMRRAPDDLDGASARSEADDPLATLDRSSLTFLAPSDDPSMIGRVGPYEIMGILGRGGFGIVLKGHDRALGRNVAIKVLDPAAGSVGAARDRFAREARAMAAISDEHVVPVYAVDSHAGLPYFVMEYVAGGSLERRLHREGRFDTISIVRIGLQMAQALAAAHRLGLVHRDIKPGNVLIDQGTERVRVADFGLARVASDVSSTKSGFLAGTPQYMAPEQVRGETCDAQSDLFSLGAVMYALCTGHAPFRAESVYGVMQRIVHDSPRPIREQNPLVPGWLEQFIFRLLEKDKTRRFGSSEETARLLREELAHLQNPSHVPEPKRSWSGLETAKRRTTSRRKLIGICGVLVALILAGGLALWFHPGPDSTSGNDRDKTAASTNRDTSPLDMKPETAEPEEALAPLWMSDGTRDARDLAERLEARWHAGEGAARDRWPQQAARLRQRLAQMSAEMEPQTPPVASKEGEANTNGNP